MASLPTRWVVVDDTSADINYIGDSWTAEKGNPIATEDTGLPYQDTLHGTNTNASLTYNFSGRAVTVKGTVDTQNVSSVDNPTWVCFVDGVQIGSDISRRPLLPTTANNWIYCQNYRLTDGPHTLTVNATGKKKTFWFDRIEYAPSATVQLENKTISVSGASDEALYFSAGWAFGQTSQRGASMSLNFVGTMLTWWTQYVSVGNSTTATWSIDDKPFQNATLPDHNNGSNLYNQKVFDTGPLAMGTHHLSVTYNGNGNNTPLALASIYIENGTFPTQTVGQLGPTSSTINSTSGTNPGKIIAPIVVGVVVGLVAVSFIIATVLYRRRRRDSLKLSLIEKFNVAPRHPPHSGSSKPHINFDNGDASPTTSPLRTQPMPRKVRDELRNSGGGGNSASTTQITQPSLGLYHPMPRKILENMAIMRGGLDHSVNREVSLPQTVSAEGRIVVHQDSGVRLTNQGPEALVIDTPPGYI